MKKLFRILFCFLLFCFSIIPIQAQDNTVWIKDNAGILSSEEAEKLETRINTLADTYDVGIYLYTVNSRDTDSIESYAEEVYKADSLGLGTEKNGILLIMDFSDRSYDIAAYGSTANTCFTDYAKQCMEEAMLSDFSDNEWYRGYDAFLNEAETDLYYGITKNDPVDYNHDPMTLHAAQNTIRLVSFFVPLAIALIVCIVIALKNRTARKAAEAAAYTGTLSLKRHDDIFTHITTHVTHINRNNGGGNGMGGGGTSINAGGFSHSSGHF